MTAGRRTAASGRLSFFGGAPIPGMCPGAGAQYKARDDEALGLVRLLGQVDVVRAHILLEGKPKAAVFAVSVSPWCRFVHGPKGM